MRLSREDALPVLVILAAGSLSLFATSAALRFWAGEVAIELGAEPQLAQSSQGQGLLFAVPATYPYAIVGAAIQEVESLHHTQQEVTWRVRELQALRSDDRLREIASLRTVKAEMVGTIAEIQRDLELAGQSQPSPTLAALGSASDLVLADELNEKIRYSSSTIEQWDPQSAEQLERDIEADLQALRQRLTRIALISLAREREQRR